VETKVLWTAVLAALLCIGGVSAATDGFEDREVLDADVLGGGLVTDFAWTHTGQMLVVKKEGQLLVFEDPAGDNSYSTKIAALDLSAALCDNSERGFQGVELHPDFENTIHLCLL
jgi:hypothetical protein